MNNKDIGWCDDDIVNMANFVSDETIKTNLNDLLIRSENMQREINILYNEGVRRGLFSDGYDKQSNIDKD